MDDSSHSSPGLFTLLASGRRHWNIHAKTARLCNSLFHRVVRLLYTVLPQHELQTLSPLHTNTLKVEHYLYVICCYLTFLPWSCFCWTLPPSHCYWDNLPSAHLTENCLQHFLVISYYCNSPVQLCSALLHHISQYQISIVLSGQSAVSFSEYS